MTATRDCFKNPGFVFRLKDNFRVSRCLLSLEMFTKREHRAKLTCFLPIRMSDSCSDSLLERPGTGGRGVPDFGHFGHK